MLLTNGRIYTLDGGGAVVDTLVVREGRIAFAGALGSQGAGRPERSRGSGE